MIAQPWGKIYLSLAGNVEFSHIELDWSPKLALDFKFLNSKPESKDKLLMNPLKHGYVSNLHDYPSSFNQIFANLGREGLVQQMHRYPGYKNLVLAEANEDDF